MSLPSFDPLKVLEAAKAVEVKGQAFYEAAAKAVSDEKVKSMFLHLAEAEIKHFKVLEATRRHFAEGFPTFFPWVQEETLTTRFAALWFPAAPSSIRSDTSRLTEVQVVERGMQLERESIELYEGAADREPNVAASNVYRWLVMEEKMHMFILTQRHDLLRLRG